jgi:hypothetical protein
VTTTTRDIDDLMALLTDHKVEMIVREAEAEMSENLDGPNVTTMQFLAGMLITKAEERPKGDPQIPRLLRAAKRLLDRARGAYSGR